MCVVHVFENTRQEVSKANNNNTTKHNKSRKRNGETGKVFGGCVQQLNSKSTQPNTLKHTTTQKHQKAKWLPGDEFLFVG